LDWAKVFFNVNQKHIFRRKNWQNYLNTHGIRFSMSGYMEHEWLTNVPLFGVGEWF
jgi:hypothetical protein